MDVDVSIISSIGNACKSPSNLPRQSTVLISSSHARTHPHTRESLTLFQYNGFANLYRCVSREITCFRIFLLNENVS